MEAIRIIREMREATHEHQPRFIVFENVFGVLSSANGRDFQKILSEITQTDIPMPLQGKWANAGVVLSDGVTVEYRVIDSQFWSVPQRRRRLLLIGDFRNGRDRQQILFKPESLYRYLTPGGAPWERTAVHAKRSTCPTVTVLNDQGGNFIDVEKSEVSPTLRTEMRGNMPVITMRMREGCDGSNAPLVSVHPTVCGTLCGGGAGLSRPAGMASETDLCVVTEAESNKKVCGTICAKTAAPNGMCNEADMCVLHCKENLFSFQGFGDYAPADTSKTILKNDKSSTCDLVTYCLAGNMIGRQEKNGPTGNGVNENICFSLTAADKHAIASVDCRNYKEVGNKSGTLQAKSTGGYSLNFMNPIRNGYIVRRLTPTECERLMNFPDGWTAFGHDGKAICDSARYQLLGNSIVTSVAAYVLAGIAEQLLCETEVED